MGLHVDPGVVPAQQDVDGIGMAQIVDPRQLSRRGADLGGTKQATESLGKARSGIGLLLAEAIDQQGAVDRKRQLAPCGKIAIYFPRVVLQGKSLEGQANYPY